MKDAERKQLLYLIVESKLQGKENINHNTLSRMYGQIHYAEMCEIITHDEYQDLMRRIQMYSFMEEI